MTKRPFVNFLFGLALCVRLSKDQEAKRGLVYSNNNICPSPGMFVYFTPRVNYVYRHLWGSEPLTEKLTNIFISIQFMFATSLMNMIVVNEVAGLLDRYNQKKTGGVF